MKFYSETRKFSFENGMELYVLPRHGCAVEVQCCVRTGSIHEGTRLGCGLSHFLEHMLFQGNATFPGRSGGDLIDRLGGSMNAYTSYDHTLYHLRIAGCHLESAVKVIGGMVMTPELPEKKFLAERDVILRECDLAADRPSNRLFHAAFDTMFRTHPLRVPIIGYRDQIAQVTREDALAYHAARYTPERAFWVIVGDVDPDEACALVGRVGGGWKRGTPAEPAFPVETPAGIQVRTEGIFPDTLSRLMLMLRMPDGISEETPALEILFGLLGSGAGSRLIRELEQRRKVALEVGTFTYGMGGLAVGGVCAECVPGKLRQLESALLKELEQVCKGDVSDAEILREKRQKYADHLRDLRNPGSVAAGIVSGVLAAGTPAATDRMLAMLEAVEPDQVRAAAEKYLAPERFVIAVLRPEERKRVSIARSRGAAKPESVVLSSGVRMVSLTDRKLPLVSFSLLLPGGAISEKAGQCGVSRLVSELLLTGGPSLPEEKLAVGLDRCGAEVEVVSGLNSLMIEMNAPREYFNRAFGWLERMLTQFAFSADPFERERDAMLERIRARAMNPRKAALDVAAEKLFGTHPYRFGRHGDPAALRGLTREGARDYYASLWNPARIICGFAGDCSAAEAAAWSERLTRNISWSDRPFELPPEPEFPTVSETVNLPIAREQCAVLRALPGPRLTGADGHRFELLAQAENGLNSHLFERVREDNSLAYSVGLKLSGGFHPGELIFYAMTAPEQVGRVEELFDEEIARLRDGGLGEAEFAAAREGAAFRIAQGVESVHTAMPGILLEMHYGGAPEAILRREAELRAFSRAGVNEAIREALSGKAEIRIRSGNCRD